MPTSLHPRDAHELAWAVALGIWVFKNSQVILMERQGREPLG